MFDFSMLLPELFKYGGPGLIIAGMAWELYRRSLALTALGEELAESKASHMDDLRTITGELKAAFATSTEVMRSNNTINGTAGQSAASLAEAVRAFAVQIQHMDETIDRLRQSVDELIKARK